LANQLLGQARYDEAIPLYESALASLKKRVGEDHPNIAVLESSLGGALVGTERQEEGLALLRSAIARSERALGAEHPQLVDFHGNYGTTLASLERYDEAEVSLKRAVALGRATMGDLHMNTVRVIYRLAELYRQQQRYNDALELVEPLLRQLEARDDAIPAQLMRLRDNAGASLYELRELDQALPLLRRNLEAFESGEVVEPYYRATAQLRLAKVLWAQGGAKRNEEARALAFSSKQGFEAIGQTKMVERLTTLLAEHR
jgi:tetratricopeptide (TPR) repeat protein